MMWWRVLLARCRALVRPQRVRDEIDEELRFHVEMRMQEHIRDGMVPADARRAAAQAFGSVASIKEISYDIRGGGRVEAVARDLRYAARALLKHRALSAVVVGVVAVGVGANAAILGVADRLLWRELPVRAPAELEQFLASKDFDAVSYPLFRALRQPNDAFSGVFARWRQPSTFAVSDVAERGVVELVSGNYFSVLGVQPPTAGRLLSHADDQTLMSHPVAVVSHRFWRTRLGGDGSAIGRTVRIDDYSFEIVGVAPPEFTGVEVGVSPDAWVPLAMHPVLFGARRSLIDDPWMWLEVIGRRAPGQSTARAQAHATLTLQQFRLASGETLRNSSPREIRLRPANRGLSPLRGLVRAPLELLMGIAALVLVIASANVATLLVIRSMARRREIAVRLALGASRGRVMRQLLTESLMLAGAGGILGTLLALRGTSALLAFLPPSSIPTDLDVTPDARSLVLSLLLSLATGILFGVAPAVRGTRVDLASVIRDEVRRHGAGRWRFGARRALVGAQVALSLVLVIGAGLFARSVQRLAATPTGFDVNHVMMAAVSPSLNRYAHRETRALYRSLQERLAAMSGVRAVGSSTIPLLGGKDNYNVRPLRVPGMPRPKTGPTVATNTVGGDFFAATGTPILRGRGFDKRDTESAPLAVVLNETAARDFFGDENPIGRAALLDDERPATIIGVARDSKYRTMRETMPAIVYTTFEQDTAEWLGTDRTIYVRAAANPANVTPALAAAVRDVDRSLPVYNIQTFAEAQRKSMSNERVLALLSAASGGIALVLAAIGLYGLIVFDTQQRTREIGVRVSLGATRSNIVALVLRGSLTMVIGGTVVGLAVSQALSRAVAAQLYEVSASEPVIVVAACATLAAAALLAALVPAWRASNVNPVEALRCE